MWSLGDICSMIAPAHLRIDSHCSSWRAGPGKLALLTAVPQSPSLRQPTCTASQMGCDPAASTTGDTDGYEAAVVTTKQCYSSEPCRTDLKQLSRS